MNIVHILSICLFVFLVVLVFIFGVGLFVFLIIAEFILYMTDAENAEEDHFK